MPRNGLSNELDGCSVEALARFWADEVLRPRTAWRCVRGRLRSNVREQVVRLAIVGNVVKMDGRNRG